MQEFLWQQVFSDPTKWWDSKRSKPTPPHPDFKHKESRVVLWLNIPHKFTWLNSQLASWDAGMMQRSPEPVSSSGQGQGALAAQEGLGMCRERYEGGRATDAVDALNLLVERGCEVPNKIFYRALKLCIAHKDLVLGRRIHALSVESGYEGDDFLATHFVGWYASHGRLEEAMRVFTKVPTPSAYSWATIIFAYARHGGGAEAIRLYRRMRESTIDPDSRIFVAVLKACGSARDLVAGKEVHSHILASAEKADSFVQTGLVEMYAKCGSLEDARSVFDRIPDKNMVTWNAMLAAYAQKGMGSEALTLYSTMQEEGVFFPDSVTFVCLLQACARIGVGALQDGKELHAQIKERGLQDEVVLGGSLVNMYAKCGSLEDARSVFDRLPDKNVVTWTSMIAGYALQGMGQEALILNSNMEQQGLSPDSITFVALLQACACVGVKALRDGKQLHAQLKERGLQDDVDLGGCLVNMYAKCGSLEDARTLFDTLSDRNIMTWNAMLTGYAQQGMGQEALRLYETMQEDCLVPPDSITFISLLQSCASIGVGALLQGKQLHALILEVGLQNDVVLGGSLVNMYAKCGSVQDAHSLFDRLPDKTVVIWNVMFAGYTQQGMGQEALALYNQMKQEGLSPNSITFICLLQACAIVGEEALHEGKQLHAQIEARGCQADVVVGGSLVSMYVKCGSLEDARSVFDRLPARRVATWNAIFAGYAQWGMVSEALDLYSSMRQEGLSRPNSFTFVCLLQACVIVAGLPSGKKIHAQIEELGMLADVVVGGALVNMYAKCGSMGDSRLVFESLPEKSVEAWGALIDGYTRLGEIEAVFDLLERMRLEGTQATGAIFLSVLTACSHVGLVDRGRKYFKVMETDYGITPTIEHYTCMIDLLGRAGHLDEALQMLKIMPFPADVAVWHTLLGACRKWNNVQIAQQAFESALRLDGKDTASYALMSNIYARDQRWEEAREMHARRKRSGAWKEPGQSWWTDLGGMVHTFVVEDKAHPKGEGIYRRLEQI